MKKLLNIFKYLVLLAIGILLFWLVFSGMDFGIIWDQIHTIHYGYVGLAAIILIAAHLSRAIRWNILIQPLGYNISKRNSFVAVMLGYLANLALPRMGEITRCMVLNRTDKVAVDKLIGTVIVERIIDMITLLIILALALVIEFNQLRVYFIDNFADKLTDVTKLFTFTRILMAVSFAVIFIIILVLAYKKYKEHTLVKKFNNLINGFIEGIRAVGKMEKKWLFIFHSFFIWFMYYMMTYVMFKALPATEHLGLTAGLTVLVMASFGFVVPVQGGIGAYHAAVLQALLLLGLSKTDGLIYAFVSHTFQTLLVVLVGSICGLYLTLAFKKIKSHDSTSADKTQVV